MSKSLSVKVLKFIGIGIVCGIFITLTLYNFNTLTHYKMNWIKLEDEQELEKIKALSASESILIFKHSTRCSISSTALNRLERTWKEEEMKGTQIYYLDLITHRNISNKIEADFNIRHESPQVLLIKNGKCEYNASHLAINYDEIAKATKK